MEWSWEKFGIPTDHTDQADPAVELAAGGATVTCGRVRRHRCCIYADWVELAVGGVEVIELERARRDRGG